MKEMKCASCAKRIEGSEWMKTSRGIDTIHIDCSALTDDQKAMARKAHSDYEAVWKK